MGEQNWAERAQPAPETEYSLQGECEVSAADFRRVWWLVPGARRARTALFPLLALSVLFGVVSLLEPELEAGIVLTIVTGAPYFLLWALGVSFARRRARALGVAPVVYQVSAHGLELRSARQREPHPWSSLRRFVEAPDAWVLYPRRGRVVLVPKRAFAQNFEHVSWQLRRRLEERTLPSWGLRLGLGLGALVAFLGLWHFFSVDSPGAAGRIGGAAPPEVVAE